MRLVVIMMTFLLSVAGPSFLNGWKHLYNTIFHFDKIHLSINDLFCKPVGPLSYSALGSRGFLVVSGAKETKECMVDNGIRVIIC